MFGVFVALFLTGGACSENNSSSDRLELYELPVLKEKLEAGFNPNTVGQDGAPLIFHAIREGRVDELRVLLSHGADPNSEFEGVPALLMDNALFNCNEDVVYLLIHHGADPNSTGELQAASPLGAAVYSGEGNCVQIVLEAGADPGIRNSLGETAMHIASQFGHAALLRQIVSVADQVDYQSGAGLTPLHYALMSQSYQSAVILLEAGADCTLESDNGTTPLQIYLENPPVSKELDNRVAELCQVENPAL